MRKNLKYPPLTPVFKCWLTGMLVKCPIPTTTATTTTATTTTATTTTDSNTTTTTDPKFYFFKKNYGKITDRHN